MKRRILLITLLVAILGVLAWLVLRPSEPVYEGKRLTYWLDQCGFGYGEHTYDAEEQARARNAIRHIGTNAIPTLLRMLRAKDSPFALKMVQLLEKQQLVKFHFNQAGQKNIEAAWGFHILGNEAKQAVPALVGIFEANISEDSREQAATALGSIGPGANLAIPALLKCLTNLDFYTNANPVALQLPKATVSEIAMILFDEPQTEVLKALGQIHSQPELVVPVLLKCVTKTNSSVAFQALAAIGNFGPEAPMAVPALLKEATNPASVLRIAALDPLGKIRSEPDVVVPVLIKSLGEKQQDARKTAVEGLGSFGPEAKSAVPALLKALHDPDIFVRDAATNALKKIDPEAAAKAGVK